MRKVPGSWKTRDLRRRGGNQTGRRCALWLTRNLMSLLDVQMPLLNSIEATRQIKVTHPAVRADPDGLRMTVHLRPCCAGADGYILKNGPG